MLGLDATMNLFKGFAMEMMLRFCFIRLFCLHISLPDLPLIGAGDQAWFTSLFFVDSSGNDQFFAEFFAVI
jgi:hypothetical protein